MVHFQVKMFSVKVIAPNATCSWINIFVDPGTAFQ